MTENTNTGGESDRAQDQQQNNPQQNAQNQQNQQHQQGEPRDANNGGEGERIDTDGDGRTRDPNDTSPTDNGGRGQADPGGQQP